MPTLRTRQISRERVKSSRQEMDSDYEIINIPVKENPPERLQQGFLWCVWKKILLPSVKPRLNNTRSARQRGPETLESQLCDAQAALTQALGDRDLLLLEIRKYDPTFNL
ncbi:hypothetical protein N1851_018464 [Merluccius polli]|uniref:Uncharacterized protein n=1 Tax=Merluccius polli TaxID=89951 RepID=A0AA47MNR8_MERPO|nr:hypothetical protein N1851_018464 [Merluccius polli]